MSAHTPAAIIFIPVEVPAAGSPKTLREVKPGPYRRNPHEPWRPQTKPPSKAERLIEFMRRVQKQDAEVRAMLRPSASMVRSAVT